MGELRCGVFWFGCAPPTPTLLLRRTVNELGVNDEVWRGGRWFGTRVLVAYMAGHEDNVVQLTEGQARALAPSAFV